MNPMDYQPYADKFNGLMVWSFKVRPYMKKKEREEFVKNIIRKKFSPILEAICMLEEKKRREIRERKEKAYEGKTVKRLEDADVGECFHFITSNGNEHYLKCVEMVECEGYDWNEWCVSERDYTYYVPRFIDSKGAKRNFNGNAALITEEEFEEKQI